MACLYLSRKGRIPRYEGDPAGITIAFSGGFKSSPYLQHNHPATGVVKAGRCQLSLVRTVANMLGLPPDLQHNAPVTLFPNNDVTCSAVLFSNCVGKGCCSRCNLPTSALPPPKGSSSARGAPGTLKIPCQQVRLVPVSEPVAEFRS